MFSNKEKNIPKPLRELLEVLPDDITAGLQKVLTYSSPNPPTIKLLAETALDIKIRTGNCVLNDEFHKLAKDSGIKDAIDSLQKIRRPQLDAMNTKLKKLILALGTKVLKIEHDQRFEDSFFEFKARIYNSDDVVKLKDELEKVYNDKRLKEIFEVYRGNK